MPPTDLISDFVVVLESTGRQGVTRKDRCWCFGWASFPCINQPQCVAAREILIKAKEFLASNQ